MTPIDALDRLLANRRYPEADVVREALEDFEWLKSVIDIDFFYRLDTDNRIKLAKILSKTCQS